jgi:hypothetical protein
MGLLSILKAGLGSGKQETPGVEKYGLSALIPEESIICRRPGFRVAAKKLE